MEEAAVEHTEDEENVVGVFAPEEGTLWARRRHPTGEVKTLADIHTCTKEGKVISRAEGEDGPSPRWLEHDSKHARDQVVACIRV